MKTLLLFLLLISIAAITRVEWPTDEIHVSGSLQPWVLVTSDGKSSASIRVDIQDPKGTWHEGPYWPVTLELGENTVFPWPVQITSDMPRGDYASKVILFDESRKKLDAMITEDAFEVA